MRLEWKSTVARAIDEASSLPEAPEAQGLFAQAVDAGWSDLAQRAAARITELRDGGRLKKAARERAQTQREARAKDEREKVEREAEEAAAEDSKRTNMLRGSGAGLILGLSFGASLPYKDIRGDSETIFVACAVLFTVLGALLGNYYSRE